MMISMHGSGFLSFLQKAMRAKVAISKDSKLYYAAVKRRRGKIPEPRIIDLSATVYTPSEECSDPLFTDVQGF